MGWDEMQVRGAWIRHVAAAGATWAIRPNEPTRYNNFIPIDVYDTPQTATWRIIDLVDRCINYLINIVKGALLKSILFVVSSTLTVNGT